VGAIAHARCGRREGRARLPRRGVQRYIGRNPNNRPLSQLPAACLTLSASQEIAPFMIAVDSGRTAIKARIVRDGKLRKSTECPTPSTGSADAVLDAIARLVLELDPSPKAVGVAMPGEVDPGGRCWGLPNVPGFKGVALGKGLSDRLRCPVAVEND